MGQPSVTFFYPASHGDIEELQALDVDQNWAFLSRVWSNEWILQTYLRLRKGGYKVDLSSEVPEAGIVVVGPGTGMAQKFMRRIDARCDVVIVTICADGARSFIGDIEIVQNSYYADETHTFFVPFWPQPGLKPRIPSRNSTIKNVVYKGAAGNLHPCFTSQQWEQFLQDLGVTWIVEDTPEIATGPTAGWHDYSNVDVVLAMRPHLGRPYYNKPASKLINAWHAGVPALLGPEYPFRELRHSELDYIEVTSLEDAMDGLRRLIAAPDRYLAMIDHGRHRAHAFTHEVLAGMWADVLFERIPRWAADHKGAWSRRSPMLVRRMINMIRRPPQGWELRAYAGKAIRSVKKKVRP